MKKIFTLLLLICLTGGIFAQNHFYDTEVVDANGNTLYFLLNDDLMTASVTYPNLSSSSPWDGFTKPTGSVVVPSSVDIYGYDYPVTRVDDHAFDGCSGITAITLPPQLTDILTYAFRNCTGITSITFPNTLRNIGDYGFYGCTGLTSVLLPPLVSHASNYVFYGCTNLSTALINDVHTIGNYAFKNCTSLTTVSMNSVTNIGNYSFESDAVLNNVTLPNSLLTIGAYAFHSCTSLSSIAIPKNVTQIGNRAFQGCTLLTNLQFNATRCMTMGASGYPVFDGCNHVNNLTIGSNVLRIPDYAFKNATGSISSVNIPDSVLYIGMSSFYNCSGLHLVTIGRGVDSIGQNAFSSCTSMATVNFNADSCRWVGGSPNTTSGDNGRVFYGDNLFTTLNIGNNVKAIPDNLFNDCSHIASITIPNSVVRIGDYAFYSCDGATSLSLGSGLRSIGGYAFKGCTHISSIITHGNNLQTIGTYAFSGCTAANTISVNAHTIGTDAFSGCTAADTISVSAQTIGSYAFSGCSKAKTISVDAYTIDGHAFQNCASAASVTSGTISVNAHTIGSSAFSGCSKANTILVDAYAIGNDAFQNCASASSITSGNISVNAHTIGTYAFYGCTAANTISVDAYIIGDYAFRNCTSAASVTLGNSTHTINQYAFYNCITLPNIAIPAAVDSIGYRAFGNCTHLTLVNFNADSCRYMSENVFQGSAVSRVVVGNGVKTIPDNAFRGLTSLAQVVFSSTVKRIGAYAFYGCTGLRAPSLSSQLNTIQGYAFSGCNNLAFASITIPANVRRIGNYAFQNCSNLQRVVFMARNCIEMGSANAPVFSGCSNLVRLVTGNGVTNIPDHAFRGVSSLHSPLLVPTIQNIGDYAFYGCSSIDTIWTRGATKTIGDYAFYGCTQAYVLNLSDQIESIGTYAFYQCSALPSMEIPNSVRFIGASAFQSCGALTSIYSKMRQIPSMSGDIFENSRRSSATLTVPCNMTSRYRANSYWNFTTIQEDNNCQTSFLISATPNHTEWGSVMGSGIYSFGDTATLIATPDSGYVFWKWDDGGLANPRQIDVTDSMEVVAIFGHSPVGTQVGNRALMGYAFSHETKPYTSLMNDSDSIYCPSSVTDIDGNTYSTVRIGFQCWMAENLRTTKYADGTAISLSSSSSTSTSVAYRYRPNNNASNVATYGYLYNWKAVMRNSASSTADPSGVQGICPTGWHVPSHAEWTQLTQYVSLQSQYTCDGNSSNIAKAMASTTGWSSSTSTCVAGNTPADNNTTGFSAVPAGYYSGSFSSFGNYAYIWSSTQYNSSNAYVRYLTYNNVGVGSGYYAKSRGYSVRCLRDNGVGQTPTSMVTAAVPGITSMDNACGTITLPFDFPFGLTTFNAGATLGVGSNGYLILGGTNTSSTLNGTNSSYNIINPIMNSDAYSGVVYYQSSNDSVTIEYVGLRSYSSPYDYMNYQVRLYPDGIIQIHYGSNTHSNSSTYWRCFMRENAHNDYFYVTGSWDNPTGKVAAVATPTGTPSDGLLYTFYPSIDTTFNSGGETPVDTTVVPSPVQVTVTVNASPSALGTAAGGGTYWSGDTITLTATPEYGFRFVNWSDGHTENPYSYIVGNVDASVTAYFDTTSFSVSITANHPAMGNLTGGGNGIYKYLRTLNFSAQPHEGYIFAGWSDGVTNPNRTVTVTRDTVIQALFADPNSLMIHDTTYVDVYVPVHDTTYVPVHDTTYLTQFDTTYINVPVHDTTFVPIHDTTYVTQFDTTYINVPVHDTTYINIPVHDTTYVDVYVPVHDTTYVNVPYPVHDTTYVTQFDTTYINVPVHDTTYINVPVHDTTYVDVYVPVHDTTYVDVFVPVHDTTYVTQFDTTYINVPVHDTTYVDVYVPVHDTTYVDVFVPVHDTTYVTQFDTTYINVPVHDTTYVDVYVPVHDTTYVDVFVSVHDTTYVTQFDTTYINVPVHDTTYVDVYVPVHDTTYVDVFVPVHDTTYVTHFDTVYVTHFDTTYVTLFDTTYVTVHDTVTLQPNMYTMTVYSNNLQHGLVAGNGEFPEGSVVEIAAIPIEGYRFVQWQDGNTQNPRPVTLTEDKTFIATFGTVGIAVPEFHPYDVYAVRNEIVVKNATGSRVRIFDARGRLLSSENSVPDEYRFPVVATGTYLVQVDNDSARKVVVVRQ